MFKIYAAGRITKERNRYGVASSYTDYLRDSSLDDEIISPVQEKMVVNKIVYKFLYTGPFTISCDHGCAHVIKHTHASMAGCNDWEPSLYGDRRQAVFKRCLSGIEQSNWIFAWIDDVKCYGTLFELGFARGLGKRIWIACTKEIAELGKRNKNENSEKYPYLKLRKNEPGELWFTLYSTSNLSIHKSANEAFVHFLKTVICSK